MTARTVARAVLLACVALVLALAARRVDLAGASAAIARLDLGWVGLAAAVMLAGKLGAKLCRSQRVLDDVAGAVAPGAPATARLLIASHAAGQLAWAPLGFAVRTVGLRAHGLSLVAIAQIHVLERLAEAAALAALALAALGCAPDGLGAVVSPGRLTAVALGAAALIGTLAVSSRRVRRAVSAMRGHGRTLARASAWAIVACAADAAIVGLALGAAGLDPIALGVAPPVLAVLALACASALPVVPAQLGVQEAAIVLALAPAGVSLPSALAAAVAYRVAHALPLALVGLPALLSLGLMRLRRGSPDRCPCEKLAPGAQVGSKVAA